MKNIQHLHERLKDLRSRAYSFGFHNKLEGLDEAIQVVEEEYLTENPPAGSEGN